MSRIAACLLLVCACAPAAARDVRMHGANGDGGQCPEIAAAVAEAEDKAGVAKSPRQPATTPGTRGKAGKPATARSGDGETRLTAPRWHSFLPGMFR